MLQLEVLHLSYGRVGAVNMEFRTFYVNIMVHPVESSFCDERRRCLDDGDDNDDDDME